MTREVRLGLVGCGRLAERGYLPAADRAPGVRIVAVADLDRDRAARLGGVLPAFGSAQDLLAGVEVDALVVATPAAAHLADAQAATERGLPVLVEKPPAPDAVTAGALAALSPTPWVGFNRRFGLGGLRDRLPVEGPLELRLRFWARAGAWDPLTVRDDVLLDLGPHLIDAAIWLGRAETVRVRGRLDGSRASLELETARGGAHIECRSDRRYVERVDARPTGGRRRRHQIGGLAGAVAARLRARVEQPLLASLTAQLTAFGVAVRGGDPGPLATAGEGAEVMSVLDAARRSAADGGRWQTVAPTDR